MKMITANRLTDGRVVYRTGEGAWTPDPDAAARYPDSDAETALDGAMRDVLSVVGPYLIEIDPAAERFQPAGRKHVRETIRLTGPSAGSTRKPEPRGGADVSL